MTYGARTTAKATVKVEAGVEARVGTGASETAEAVRQARFGQLPDRIRMEDMVAAQPASLPDPAKDTYNVDEWTVRYCL